MRTWPVTVSSQRSGCRKHNLAAPRFAGARLGFTLVELLTAMAILLVLVGILAAAFNSASNVWRSSEREVERFQQARAALDLIARDLSQAIVSPTVPFYGNITNLAFVAANVNDTNALDLSETVYCLSNRAAPFKLVRRFTMYTNSVGTASDSANVWDFYSNNDWPETYSRTNIVCDNVVGLSFTFYATNNAAFASWNSSTNANPWPEMGSWPTVTTDTSNLPPTYINIELQVVDSRTAALLTNLTGTAYGNVITQATRTFNVYVKIPQR